MNSARFVAYDVMVGLPFGLTAARNLVCIALVACTERDDCDAFTYVSLN